MRNLICTCIFTLLAGLWVGKVDAGITVTSGTLHAYGQDGPFTAAPPDVAFSPPSTSISAMLGPGLADGTAKETVGFVGGQVQVSTYTYFAGGTETTSGIIDLQEDVPQPMWVRVNPSTVAQYYVGQIALDAIGGGNVFSVGGFGPNSEPPFDFVVSIAPGQYRLTWSDDGRSVLNRGGAGGFDFTMGVPEPSSLSLLMIGGIGVMRRRRRRK